MSDASDANGHSNGHADGYTNGHIMSEQNNQLNPEAAVVETAVTVAEPETSPHPATTQAPDITESSITTKSWTPQSSTRKAKKELGLRFVRRFTRAGEDPFNTVEWELRTAGITGEDGKIVFEQRDCEIPKTWSQLATNVVVSKYFRGRMDSPQRETSVRQVIGRVADTFGRWGREGGYFASDEDASAFRDELVYLLLHQYGSFNSPVWFNIGVKGAHQQASACFINSVHDNMESIMELAATEARLFKGGSGAGSNLSRIRSSKEHLSGGGIASGPVSFMRGWDAFAGAIKSGGTTRRAAKMVILDAQHPDIEEFINAKAIEEKKAWALIEAGYNGGFNMPGGAYDSVDFQNANHSVRASDEFMRAADNNTEWSTHSVTTGEVVEKKNARQMLRAIAEATHICGDPGMQYDTTINDWHTSSNTDRIYASNPCSEFLYLDDTACNLASMNLMKFRQANGEFDSEMFVHASEVFITAQEIIVSNASYPTEKIAKNSEKFRPLGLGYANLGALLMAQGTAYDSDEGRALAGAITAIMTGAAYRQSAKIAANIGAFEGYKENREPMLRVIGKHRDAVSKIPRATVPVDTLNTAQRVWDEALLLGQKHGFRNAQATVLAPTGTIAFMMDCDTTGIEPDIALVKYKKLVGGGLLKIVNQTVPEALQKLGYSSTQSDAIIDYIDKNDTIEGAPSLKEQHLPVFDCAFKAQNGTRSIHYMGHIRMMAAAQPFISGAISKTVNVPSEASVDDILQAYMESWKLGLKAVAIYRDGSKRTQPLSTTTDAKIAEAKEAKDAPRALRRKLPDERHSITHKFSIAGQEGYFTVGLYEDGSPGEIFIKMSKEGSTISGLMDSFAVAISMCLQYGVPLRVLVNKFSHSRFEPSGYTTNKEIPIAKSLMDYIFRWFDLRFHPNGSNGHLGKEAHAAQSSTGLSAGSSQPALMAAPETASHNDYLMHGQLSQAQSDAPPCTECGTLMIRAGACYKCPNCGTTSGCG
jgi:ribonucleoside-diphosphate reductase alpha chain